MRRVEPGAIQRWASAVNGQRHAYVTNSTREWCDRCGTTWPCEVISTVAFHIGMTR